MYKKLTKKFLALFICLVITLSNLIYADTVYIGVAPGLTQNGRNMTANTNTSYLQNLYTGPGNLPNSSITGLTPIQGVSVDYTKGQAAIDNNGASYTGPQVTTITSPAANNAAIANQRSISGVISNGAFANDTHMMTNSTSDTGPTVADAITYPKGSGEGITSEGPGVSNQSTNTSGGVPSYTTGGNYTAVTQSVNTNSDVVIYKTNDFIQAAKPNVSAGEVIVVNATTRQIYFSKGGFTQRHPASLANLVTAAILLANKNLDDVLIVSASAVSGLESGATTAGLKAGDTITVRDAIAAMFVSSCCDVANVAAEAVAGSIANFVNVMNQTAKKWGCINTNFVNPTGLNHDAQLTTTYDMAVIMDKVTSNPTLKLMLQQAAYTLPATSTRSAKALVSKNNLLIQGNKSHYPGISASRMGYTSKARYTIASELDYNGQRLIAVVLYANGSQWTDTTKLLNFAKVASLEATTQSAIRYTTTFNTNTQASQASVNTASQAGDTVGTWAMDNIGWYFMKADGQRAKNEWIKNGGKLYCVDSSGYMIKGWRQMSNGNTYYFDPNNGELRHSTWVNVSTGAYYLQDDGSLAKASRGTTTNITTAVGVYTIDENGKAIAKVS